MPVVLTVGPHKFFFYSNEGIPLKAPHIHVRGAGGEAKISLLEPYAVLESTGFSAPELRRIRQIVQEKHAVLLGAYHEHFA